MLYRTIIFVLSILLIETIDAQDKFNDRVTVSLKGGYSLYYEGYKRTYGNGLTVRIVQSNYRIESTFQGKMRNFRVCPYIGYSSLLTYPDTIGQSQKKANAWFYGSGFMLNVLPFFVDETLALNLYLRGEIGGHQINAVDGYVPNGKYFDTAIGGGVEYVFPNNLGLYAEYTFGSYTDLRVGVVFFLAREN